MTRHVIKVLSIQICKPLAIFLMVLFSSLGQEAQSGIINPEIEFEAMHQACLNYFEGDESAIIALGGKGYTVRKRGNRIVASKKSNVNQAPNVFITIGKKIPSRAQKTCKIEVSRIRHSRAQIIHSQGILKLTMAGIIPEKSNGITFPKFRRGAETFVVRYEFNQSAGIYILILSKMR